MQKIIIRKYKTHYGARWCMLKNNLYNSNVQWVHPIDMFIKKNLNPSIGDILKKSWFS